jgi:hypothetical protein
MAEAPPDHFPMKKGLSLVGDTGAGGEQEHHGQHEVSLGLSRTDRAVAGGVARD